MLLKSALVLLLLSSFSVAPAIASDVVFDFSIASNPNGVWSYGSTPTLGGAFTLFSTAISPTNFIGWANSSVAGSTPVVYKNISGSDITSGTVFIPVGWLNMHPADNGSEAVVRFTVPTTGSYTIAGQFRGHDTVGTTTDVHLLLDSIPGLFNDTISGYLDTSPFSIAQLFTAGETIDFVVGNGGNGFSFDSTGLQASITVNGAAVPEPGAFWTAAAALVAVVLYRRRRSAIPQLKSALSGRSPIASI